MGDISKNSQFNKTYTVHCLRAAAIQGMNDAGLEIRHILHMSGHLNESSVKTYNRDCSTAQKKLIAILYVDLPLKTDPTIHRHFSRIATMTTPDKEVSTSATATPAALSMQSSHFLSSGLMSNSTFNNRVF